MSPGKTPTESNDTNRTESHTDLSPQRERTLYEYRFLQRGLMYRVLENEADRKTLQEWKAKIDMMIGNVKTLLAKEQGPTANREKRILDALGQNPTAKDITLFCISQFVHLHRKAGSSKFIPRALWKLIKGGKHNISELGSFDTCVDTAGATLALAQLYNIPGKIVFPLGDPHHVHWQEEGDKQAIIDTFWLQQSYGYLNDPELFQQKHVMEP